MLAGFSDRGRQAIELARAEATSFEHDHVGTGHLLLGLLGGNDNVAACALRSLDLTVERVRTLVMRIVGADGEAVAGGSFTPRAGEVLELARHEAATLGRQDVGPEHILLSLVRENGGVAARVLRHANVRPDRVAIEVIPRLWAPLGERPAKAAAGERSLEPQTDALRRAIEIRLRRAQLKRDLGTGRASLETLLRDPPAYVEAANVLDMLIALPKFGRVTATELLTSCGISPSKTIGGLSSDQRGALFAVLRTPRDP